MFSDLTFLTYMPCAVLVLDQKLKPLSGSRKGFSVFGIRMRMENLEEALGDLEGVMGKASTFMMALQEVVMQVRRPGSESNFQWERGGRTYRVVVGALTGGESFRYGLLFNDVTLQIRFEKTQEMARRYLEDILNNVQLGVVVLNREMRITNMNRTEEAFLGRLGIWVNWIEAIGTPISELVPQDPKSLWKEITGRVLGLGESYEDPHRIYTTSEGNMILSIEVTPLKDQHGEVIGAIKVSEDVTDRVRLEEELQEAEILAQRLEAVRQTAITVNHEVNNPLTTILGAAQVLMLSQKEELGNRTWERLKLIEHEVKRIAAVTKRLQSLDKLKMGDYIVDGPKMIDLGMKE